MGPQLSLRARFGQELRQLRREKSAAERRDVTQQEVATYVRDTQPNVAKWESGKIPDDEATVEKLAEFYGVNYLWLRLNKGEKRPAEQRVPILRPMPRPEPEVAASRPAAKKTQGRGR